MPGEQIKGSGKKSKRTDSLGRPDCHAGIDSSQKKRLPVAGVENRLAGVMNILRKMSDQAVAMAVAGILILSVTGCSSFNRAWRSAEKIPVTPDSMAGRWQGHWSSDANGHSGKLLCIVSRQNDGDYAARFRATYMKILKFSYTVPLKVEPQDGGWHFHGEENLGSLAGGVYQYEGKATLTNFNSTYRSTYDHGVFEMERPATQPIQPEK